jgi:hypothetical protein
MRFRVRFAPIAAALIAAALVPPTVFAADPYAPERSETVFGNLEDEEDKWWYHPLSLALLAAPPVTADPPAPAVPFDPSQDYAKQLGRFIGIASSTIKKGNAGALVTTNYGRFPFDDAAISDGIRLFERLPGLDITGLTIYPAYDSSTMNRIPEIIRQFRDLKRPVEITEIGVCTTHQTPDQQRILLGLYLDMLKQIPPSSIYLYELQDHNLASTDVPCESTFGLKYADGTPKPSYQLFLQRVEKDPNLGVTTRILFSEEANLDADAFRLNVADLASHGVKNLNLTTEWWKVAVMDRGRLVWDEEKWDILSDAIEYAASKDLNIRLHTSPPWEDGTTVEEYEAGVVEYYERIATLADVQIFQIYNETNQHRFTDYGPVARLF